MATSQVTIFSTLAMRPTPYPILPGCGNPMVSESRTLKGFDPRFQPATSSGQSTTPSPCLPPAVTTWYSQLLAPQIGPTATLYALSPLVCPEGYTTAPYSSTKGTETTMLCCPAAYTYIRSDGLERCTSRIYKGDVIKYMSTITNVRFGTVENLIVETTATKNSEIDAVSFWGVVGPTGLSPRPTGGGFIGNDGSSDGAAKAKAIGIGVGVGLGIVCVGVIAWLFWHLRKKKRANREEEEIVPKRSTKVKASRTRSTSAGPPKIQVLPHTGRRHGDPIPLQALPAQGSATPRADGHDTGHLEEGVKTKEENDRSLEARKKVRWSDFTHSSLKDMKWAELGYKSH